MVPQAQICENVREDISESVQVWAGCGPVVWFSGTRAAVHGSNTDRNGRHSSLSSKRPATKGRRRLRNRKRRRGIAKECDAGTAGIAHNECTESMLAG